MKNAVVGDALKVPSHCAEYHKGFSVPSPIGSIRHHRAHVWLAEREPQDRDTRRQAREKLSGHGLTGLFHAVFATSLFVQSLACTFR